MMNDEILIIEHSSFILDSVSSSSPAAFPDLRWEAGSETAGPAGAHVERLN
jgi:hypothetical protein